MPFINQSQDLFDGDIYACGAFAIAYYRWQTNNPPCQVPAGLQATAQQIAPGNQEVGAAVNFVQGIYSNIKFGDNDLGLPTGYSNPVDMEAYLNEINGINVNLFFKQEGQVQELVYLFNQLGNPDHLPDIPGGAGYLLAICRVGFNGLHYVLAHKNVQGVWDYIIDPSNGMLDNANVIAYNNFINNGNQYNNLTFLKAGIWIS